MDKYKEKQIEAYKAKISLMGLDDVIQITERQGLIVFNASWKIEEKHIKIPDFIDVIYSSAFMNNDYLEEITLGKNTTVIEEFAFYNCKNLKRINNADNVKEIGKIAFGSSKIESIESFIGVEKILGGAFNSCKRLKVIKTPSTLKHMGAEAFSNCTGLEKVELNKEIEYLGDRIFTDCESLKIVSMNCPNIDSISTNMFNRSENLETVYMNNNTKVYLGIESGISIYSELLKRVQYIK